MEADQVTEKPHTTVESQEHISSKDPSAEDFQELSTSETILEPSIPETPLVPLTSDSLLVPSSSPQTPLEIHPSAAISETPLEALTSEYNVMPSSSLTPLDIQTSETILESAIAETPLEVLTSEFHMVPSSSSQLPSEVHPSAAILEPSISETPLETLTSETHIMPSSSSQMLMEIHPSASPLEPSKHPSEHSTSEFPLEIHIPQVPEENFIVHTLARRHSSVSSSDYLKEDFVFPSSSNEGSSTRRDLQISDYESLQQHTPPGSSAQIQLDKSAEQKEEEKEDEKGVDVTDSTAQPEHQLGKKKGKKGYPVQPVVPAKQGELVEVAKAMPREKFGAQVQYRFQWEKNTALCALQTGLYIGWRCPHYLWDCFRIRDESKCFCGHLLKEHQIISEEVGEFWLKRRATFDPKAWRAQCRCKHNHEDHAATGSHPCRIKGCCCDCFESNFLCAACDRRWEEHETFFETEETRRRGGRPHGTNTVNTWHRPL